MEVPLFRGIFTPYDPSIMAYLWVIFFANMGGWGWSELFSNIYHHHPESKKRKSSEENSGFIHPYCRYGNAVKTRITISTIAILWPVKAIFENRAATVEVDSFVSPVKTQRSKTHVVGRRLLNGKPQERLRFRDLHGKTLASKKRIAILSCVLDQESQTDP